LTKINSGDNIGSSNLGLAVFLEKIKVTAQAPKPFWIYLK
jgi:hypothetical protein